MWDSRTLPTELSWTILVLLPKFHASTQGICLLEVLWNVVEAIIDTWINTVVKFYDVLHGFSSNRGMGVAIMDHNMAQDLASIDQDSLFPVLLDLYKAYDTQE